jgi:SET domain-containing protein
MTTETAEPSTVSDPPSTCLKVRASGVHGLGVYATRFIAKDTCIIEYTGKRVLWKDVPKDVDDAHTFLFGLTDGIYVIDPEIGGNEARWINHSCDPNCEAIEDENDRVFIHALRDIQPGEELFYDYALQVDEPRTKEIEQESPCHCGAVNCRGTLLEAK